MRETIAIALKDLRLLLRDKAGFFFVFFFPLLIAIFFGTVFVDLPANWTNWSAADLKPYIDFAIEHLGTERLMFGSDWPVAILAGDYAMVWAETNKALAGRPQAEIDAILGGTAVKAYRI